MPRGPALPEGQLPLEGRVLTNRVQFVPELAGTGEDTGVPDPLERLCTELRVLRRSCGDPSFRTIAKATGTSHTTVGNLLNGASCPSWEVVSRVVGHLGGDPVRFRKLWAAVRDLTDPLPDADGDDDSAPRPLMKLDRSVGPRSEVLWIYDPKLARQVLAAFFPAEEADD
jgi:hypothetical protein